MDSKSDVKTSFSELRYIEKRFYETRQRILSTITKGATSNVNLKNEIWIRKHQLHDGDRLLRTWLLLIFI